MLGITVTFYLAATNFNENLTKAVDDLDGFVTTATDLMKNLDDTVDTVDVFVSSATDYMETAAKEIEKTYVEIKDEFNIHSSDEIILESKYFTTVSMNGGGYRTYYKGYEKYIGRYFINLQNNAFCYLDSITPFVESGETFLTINYFEYTGGFTSGTRSARAYSFSLPSYQTRMTVGDTYFVYLDIPENSVMTFLDVNE